MRITRFSPGPDGESQFSEIELSFPKAASDNFGHTIVATAPFASAFVQISELPAGLDQPWHPAPRRQLVTILAGVLEVGTPDGHTRSFGRGDVFLADDMGTKGHTTRTVDGPVNVLITPLPDDAAI
ncbi:MAG: hypothetical protein ACKVWR_01355 [Acidimicrobiales bacterium]